MARIGRSDWSQLLESPGGVGDSNSFRQFVSGSWLRGAVTGSKANGTINFMEASNLCGGKEVMTGGKENNCILTAFRLGHKLLCPRGEKGKRGKGKKGVLSREKSKQEGFANCCVDWSVIRLYESDLSWIFVLPNVSLVAINKLLGIPIARAL